MREERKVVTVLFADLVGFTSRSEQLDPEDVRAVLAPYHARLRDELERYGGTVEKFIGDAVMAVFGAPVAHEDDPERAVRAALAIRSWIVDDQAELQVRIGVNTGETIVNLAARPAEGEGMVAGDVVNTAARLQSAAAVNGILVGAQTYEATNVRDFTITAAPDFRTRSALVGTRNVIAYYRPGQDGAAILRSAVSSLSKLQKLLGAYPYRTYRVAQSAGGLGMESPALAWIPYGLAPSRLPYLVGHETAHQWFYALVGSDQAKEPFADEASADFVTRYMLGSKRGSVCATDELDRSIYGYSRSCYYETIYIQGGNLLDTARRRMGSTAFWTALRGYLTAHRFGLASTKQLLQAIDEATTQDLSMTFASRFPRIY